MQSSFRIGKLFGIDIFIHISWFLVFALLSLSLSEGYFPTVIPDLTKFNYWVMGSLVTILLFVSILGHELSHSLTAIKNNIPIRRITLFIFGGIAQLEREPDDPKVEAKITIAGPLASIVIALIFAALYWILPGNNMVSVSLKYLSQVNLIIAFINLIPAFPLDGGRLFRAAIWYRTKSLLRATKIAVSAGSFLSFLIIALGIILIFNKNVIGGLWYVFIGWLLYQAGQSTYSQLTLKNTFSGVKIEDIMSHNVKTVHKDAAIKELVDLFFEYKYGAFPVIEGSSVIGLVSLHQVREIPREKWETTTAGEIMIPLKKCYRVNPNDEAVDVMIKMASGQKSRALVMDGDTLVGILSKTDIMRFIDMHMVLGSEEK